MAQRTILLIDYDPQSIEATVQPLVDAGYRVEVAQDGLAGLEAFQRLLPDLVLIEPMVPKKHGFEVCQEIKGSEKGRSTPVLITTGFYRGHKHRLEAKQYYGCDEYLERPFEEETLLSTCRRFLSESDVETDEPSDPEAEVQALEELSEALDSTVRPDDGLPALDNLSEEEIAARLDALIIEEPVEDEASGEGGGKSPAPEFVVQAEYGGPLSSVEEAGEPIELDAARLLDPLADAPRESSAEETEDSAVAATTAAEITGTDLASPASSPATRSLRPWRIAAILAGVAVIAVPAVLLGTGLFRPSSGNEEVTARSLPQPRSANPGSSPSLGERAGGAILQPPAFAEQPADLAVDEGPNVIGIDLAPPPQAEAPVSAATSAPKPVSRDAAVSAATPQPRPRGPASKTEPAPERPRNDGPARTEPRRADRTDGPKVSGAVASTEATSGMNSRDTLQEREPPGTAEQDSPGPGPISAAAADPSGAADASPTQESDAEPGPTSPARHAAPIPPAPSDSSTSRTEPQAAVEEPVVKLAPGTLLSLAEVDSFPAPVSKRPPDFPAAARRLGHSGIVNLRLLVNERGSVDEVTITSSDAGSLLDRAALKTARQWVYRPATKDGVPVKVWITEQIAFKR